MNNNNNNDIYNNDNYYVKSNVEPHEYEMHKYAYDLHVVNVPKIVHYDKNNKVLVMEKIVGDNLSNIFGEESHCISDDLYEEVRYILKTLLQYDIEYIDITGYNFILDNNQNIWIIDFEHSKKRPKINSFLESFCNGLNEWNPDFR